MRRPPPSLGSNATASTTWGSRIGPPRKIGPIPCPDESAARYAGTLEPIAGQTVLRLVDEPRLGQALILGLALRLAYSLSGATRRLLKETSLRLAGDRLTLVLPKNGAVMYGEAVDRRLEALGRAIGRGVATASARERRAK